MNEYSGKSERHLRDLLEDCTNFQERRKIRAAIKELHRPPGGPSHPVHPALNGVCPQGALDTVYRATPYSPSLPSRPPLSSSSSPSSASSLTMASASLSSRPPLSHGLMSHRRGTLAALPSFSRDRFGSGSPTTTTTTTTDGLGSREGGPARDGESLSRLPLKESRFLSASVFDKPDSRNGVSSHSDSAPHVPPHHLPPNLHRKRHSLGHVLSGSLLPGFEASSSTGGSLFADGLHAARPAVTSPGDAPKRINIRRSSHVFLSDGEAHSPTPPLLSPLKRDDGDRDDDVFVVPDKKAGSLLTSASASSVGDVRGADRKQWEGRPMESTSVQGREAVSVTTAGYCPVALCEDEDELLDLLCTTEDIKERLKIRARLRQLKEAREGRREAHGGQQAASTRPGAPFIAPTPASPLNPPQHPPATLPVTRTHPPATDGTRAAVTSQREQAGPSHRQDEAKVKAGTDQRPDLSQEAPGEGVPLGLSAGGGALPEAAARGNGEGAGVGVDVGDYGHIQDIEELRRLLSATLDFDEKRKIRNVMRELRKTGDGEKARSDAPLTKPAEDSHRKDQDARATRSTVTLKETDQVKVGPPPGERTSSVGRSQSLRAERDAAASVASVGYTPFERRPSQAGKKGKDISALVSEKVQAALSEKLLQTAPASTESRDKPLGHKGDKAQGTSLRSDSEAERKGRESDLSALVKEKVQAALSEKIHVAQAQPGKDSSSELRQEKSAVTAALQRSEKKPVVSVVSDSKRTPGSRANSKSWEDTLRGPNASPPVPKTSHKAAVKSAAVSTDKNAKQEEPGRSPVSQKGDDQVRPNKSDSKSWDAAEDGRSRAAGLADRQNPPEAKDATDSPRRPSSPFHRERGQLQRPSSPLQSRSLQKDRTTPSPIQSGSGEVIGRRPSSPRLRSPSSPLLRSPSSPLQPHIGGHDKRPASPFQSISTQHNRRASSPFLSEGPPLDRRAASPLQAPVRPQIRRPSSPFLSEGSSRRAASPLPSQVGQRDKGPASPLLSGDLPQQPQLTARSFQPVIRKEEKRLSALSQQQQQQPETSKGFVVVATKKRDASPARVPEQLQEKKPPCQSSESQVILTEFSARQAQPVATRLLTDETERGSETDRNSTSPAVDLPSELQRDSSVEESTKKPEKQNTSVTRKESFNWDLLNKVKARLSSRSESLSSEEKYQAAIRARASLSSSSDSLDNDAKKIAEVKGEEKSADDRRVRQPAVDVVKSTEQRKPTEPVHAVQPVQTADQRRASEPRYKEVRELARNTPARKDDPELKESPTGAAEEDQQQLLSDFQRLDKGLKPSVSKSRVSTLADKFAAADSGSETPGSQLKFFAVGSKQSKPVKKTESFKASPRAENSEAGPKSRLPRRAESLNAHDSQRRPVLVKKQVSPVAEVEARTQGDAQTPRAQDLRRDADSSEAKASLRDSNASRGKVRESEAKPVRAVEVAGGTGRPPVAEGVRAEDDKATARASTQAMTKDHPAAVTSSAPQPGSVPAAKKVPGSAAMEQAFSALLDDIETFSASEGTGSDLDLSDSDETVVDKPPSATAGALKDSGPSLKDNNGNSIKDTIGVAKDTNSKDAAGVSASAVKRSNSLNRGSNAVPLAPVAEVAEYRALTTERKEDGPVAAMTKEDSGIGMGAGDLDDVDTAAPESTKAETIQSSADADTPTTTLPSLTDDEDGTAAAAAAAAQTQPLATLEEEDSAPPPPPLSPPPPPLPAPAEPEMTSSAFVVLKPQTEAAGQAPYSQPPQLERTVSVIEDVGGVTEDQEGEVTYRKVSKDDEHSRVVTIRSKVRRTPSNADEEIRDTVVETDFHSPGGAAVKDRDVIRSRRKITPRGSNYYQRTAHRTRRVRDQEGSDFVEHDVCVESDNTSISEGRSWGSKTVTKVTLDRPSGGLPPALDELARLPQLEAPRTGKVPGAGAPLVRMDMSKASSGYGSVSGSEEEDKDTSPPPDLKTAGSLVGAPEVLAPLKDVSTVEGHGAVLECTLSAQPAPEVTWYLGDKKLDTSKERFSAHFDAASGKATLTLQEAVVGDGGEYTCVCSNEFGEASTRSSLLVKPGSSETTVVPMFLTKLPNKTLNDGDFLLLECDVIGSPEPNIRWLRDGLDLPDSLSFNSQYDGRVARLRVERMAVEDEGLFECVAENSAGKVSMDARVHVQKRNKAPSFSSCLQDVTVELGHNVCLRCQVSGTPAPSVFWRRNGLIVADTPDFLQSLTRGLARLEIFGVKDKHGGQYECVAKNDAGDAVCSCYLTVTHPKATEPPAEAAPPPVTTRRTFKKLSEPQHSDIISAVLVSAGKKTGVQRAQSFSPQSAPAPAPKDSARPPGPLRAFSVQAPGTGEARPLEGEREALNGTGVSADSASVGDTDVKAVSRYTVQWRDRQGRLVDGPGRGSPSPSPSSTATSSTSPGPPTTTTTTTRDNASSSAAADSPRPAATTTTTTTSSPPQAVPDQDSQLPVPVKTAPPAAARGRASPSPERKLSEPPKASPQAGKSPRSMVSQLRAQFNKLEETADRAGGSGGGIRRWHSMPLKQERPTVVKRGPSQLAVEDRGSAAAAAAAAVRGADATETATMSSYDHINDEEELHKLMNATESFEERKKIRTRLREIRDKQREEMEARRLQREKETEDLIRRKFEIAEEEKKRKMQAFNEQKPTCERDTQYHSTSQKLIQDKHQLAEEEKQKKLEAYKQIAQKVHQTDDGKTSVRTTTTTTKAPDGSTTVTKKTETTTSVKQTSGFGGVQYGAPRAAPAKPQGPRGAMAAFKQMDASNPAPKPNKPMARSPSAIKQVLLDWCKAMTREYENIQVTNFSSSWNNGLAFCALIHHFYPDAFDYSQLDPKNRRYNFNLAFDTAEKLADIAPLLDVEDMVRMKNPDWKCVFTYVQSIYRHLRDHENNKTKVPAEA